MVFEKGKTVYESIVNEYKRYIECGVYKFEDKLPSVRKIASDLGVNPNTVVKAYVTLEEMGYIKTFEKKGAYVVYNGSSKEKLLDDCKKKVKKMKESGITYDELLEVVKGEYL